MPRTDTIRGSTLCDSSRLAAAPEQSRLVFVGSPEDGFAHAGQSFPLAGLRRVEFRRAERGPLTSSIEGGVLRICMPHPWVSSHHADLELDGNAELVDLESRNGTLLEGDMIERAVLHSGDIFEVGRCFFALRQTKAPAHEPTTELHPVAHPDYAASMHALERLAPTRVPLLLIGDFCGSALVKGHPKRASVCSCVGTIFHLSIPHEADDVLCGQTTMHIKLKER